MSDTNIRTIVLAANEKVVEPVGGRIFRVLSATGNFTVSIDGGAPIPMAKARGLGSKAAAQFQSIVFVETSGSANTIQYYAGDEEIVVEETQTVTLDVDSVTAINPDAVSFKPGFRQLTNEIAVFNSYQSLSIENTGAVNITVTTAEGALIFPPGKKVDWSGPRWKDHLGNISIDTTGGGTADVISLRQ